MFFVIYYCFIFIVVNMSYHFAGPDEGAVHAPKYIGFLTYLSYEKLDVKKNTFKKQQRLVENFQNSLYFLIENDKGEGGGQSKSGVSDLVGV